MNLTVRPVTVRACARPAPGRPAGYAQRWTDRSQDGTVSSLGVPERTDRDGARREGVVEVGRSTAEVEATQTRDSRLGIQGPSPWHPREKADSLFKLVCEDLYGAMVLDPPSLRGTKLIARDLRENDPATLHFDRSSRRTSSASVRRPASISAPDATSARCSAARSSSSSQSPGSNGSRSISVPSGRSVGSSTTKRPFRTHAFSIMPEKIPANAVVDNRGLRQVGKRAVQQQHAADGAARRS